MTAAPSAQLPSKQRPIPLKMRNDLVVRRIEYRGVGSWVVKDPVGLKYHRLQPEQYAVLTLLDGQRSLQEVRDELKQQFPTLHFTLADVQHLVTDLHQKVLVYSNRTGQGAALIKQHRKNRRQQLFKTIRNVLYIRLPGWDPERTLQKLYPWTRWMFRPWAASLATILVLSSWILLGVQFDTFYSRLPEFQQFFGWPNLIYLWATLGVAKIIHEFGHGLSCKHFGGECHSMGLLFLVFSPCLYCDVTDSWMLRSKWARFFIGGAGMYIEIVLSAVAVFVWWNTRPGLLNHLALNVFFVTTVTTVIFNANPLMRFDGYYMLSDLLEIPNLRPKADKMLREKFAWYCLGIESRPDPFMPETGKVWFVLYAIAATLYRWFILFVITLFLYRVLKPYDLQSIGITLAVVSVASILSNLVINVYKIITAPRTDPMDYRKLTASFAVLGALIAAVVMIPIPWHLESSFLVEPYEVQHVYVSTPGRLSELRVEPGQRVQRGDVLARLSNQRKEDELHSLKVRESVLEARVEMYRAMGDVAEETVAQQQLRSVRSQRRELEDQLRKLTIVAPCDGRVVAAPRRPKPKRKDGNEQLPKWFGTPLDPKNAGCYLEEGTHLLSVGPSDRNDAILLIDQANRNDMHTGQTVELKFEHLPGRTYVEKIREISERHVEYAPEALSNKAGGTVPTTTDKQGRERLTSPAYKAAVPIDETPELIRPGMQGQARVLIDERSIGEWIYRWYRQTFNFRL